MKLHPTHAAAAATLLIALAVLVETTHVADSARAAAPSGDPSVPSATSAFANTTGKDANTQDLTY
jgi:hypothetical protein